MESLAKRLCRLRLQSKLTQKEVASRLGISPSTYRDWEYGNKIMGEPYLKLSEIFSVSVYELLTGRRASSHELMKEIENISQSVNSLKKVAQALL